MTERAKERIRAIRENQEARNKYRDAISALRELYIFDILRERILDESFHGVPEPHVSTVLFNRLMGYIRCIDDLQSLLDTPQQAASLPLDFGARESLKEQGYTDDEIVKMLGEE